TEAFCATYNIDLFVVVYSVVDRGTFKAAEKVLTYLKENDMLLTRGAILVANKTDLERHREVSRQVGRKLAKEIACKFIETSSGLDHNVDELLVGIVAQVKLNPQRLSLLSEYDLQRLNLQTTIQKHRRMHLPARRMVRQMSIFKMEDGDEREEDDGKGDGDGDGDNDNNKENENEGQHKSLEAVRRAANRRTLNLECILKMGESELEEEESNRQMSKFEQLAASMRQRRAQDEQQLQLQQQQAADNNDSRPSTSAAAAARRESNAKDELESAACNRRVVNKLTKVFLSSVLRFRTNMKRRNSSSCTNLFVI
ncbi:hypothetical protein AWZ03_013365, partial [Drosophila navojoa]